MLPLREVFVWGLCSESVCSSTPVKLALHSFSRLPLSKWLVCVATGRERQGPRLCLEEPLGQLETAGASPRSEDEGPRHSGAHGLMGPSQRRGIEAKPEGRSPGLILRGQ